MCCRCGIARMEVACQECLGVGDGKSVSLAWRHAGSTRTGAADEQRAGQACQGCAHDSSLGSCVVGACRYLSGSRAPTGPFFRIVTRSGGLRVRFVIMSIVTGWRVSIRSMVRAT